jgi:hypothetical protein
MSPCISQREELVNRRWLGYLGAAIVAAGLNVGAARATDPAPVAPDPPAHAPAQHTYSLLWTWLHNCFCTQQIPVDPSYPNREESKRFICCPSDDFFAGNWRRPSPLPSDQPLH